MRLSIALMLHDCTFSSVSPGSGRVLDREEQDRRRPAWCRLAPIARERAEWDYGNMSPRTARRIAVAVLIVSAAIAVSVAVVLPLVFQEPPNWWSLLGAASTSVAMVLLIAELRKQERRAGKGDG